MENTLADSTRQLLSKWRRKAAPSTLSSCGFSKWPECAVMNTIIYSRYRALNITLCWGTAIIYVLSSTDCPLNLMLAPICITSISLFMPADPHTPKFCCCVPTHQKACRPVQEIDREEKRKRGGSQLRLGNGRENVSVCARAQWYG